MKRIAIGAVTGLAVWFASAVAAEAQQITPTGPMHIYNNDTSVTVSATVTTNWSFTMYLTTSLIRNGVSTQLPCGGSWLCITAGPSYNWSTVPALDCSGWGMQTGDIINFHLVAQINALHRGIYDYQVTVETRSSGPSSKIQRLESGAMMAKGPSGSAKTEAVSTRKEDMEVVLALKDWIVA
jgi:hypothetical protein